MSEVVGVQTISVGLVEKLGTSIVEWKEAREGIEVNHWNSPYIANFLNSLDVLIEEDSTIIFVHFVGLDVFLARAEKSTVYWCHHYDLLGGVHLFKF